MAENQLAVKTRSVMDAQRMENDAEHQQIQTNTKIVPDQLHHPHNGNTQGIV